MSNTWTTSGRRDGRRESAKTLRSASGGGDGVGGAAEGSHAAAPAFMPFEESYMPCEGVAGSLSEAQADGSRATRADEV